MTQRTEGLVTYVEEVTRATVKRGDEPVAGVTVGGEAGLWTFGVWSGDEDLSSAEIRALRDAITVMLGEDTAKCAVCLEECGVES